MASRTVLAIIVPPSGFHLPLRSYPRACTGNSYEYDIAADGNEDWAKGTLDLGDVKSAEELLAVLDDMNMTLAHFVGLPIFEAALASGRYPWLFDL